MDEKKRIVKVTPVSFSEVMEGVPDEFVEPVVLEVPEGHGALADPGPPPIKPDPERERLEMEDPSFVDPETPEELEWRRRQEFLERLERRGILISVAQDREPLVCGEEQERSTFDLMHDLLGGGDDGIGTPAEDLSHAMEVFEGDTGQPAPAALDYLTDDGPTQAFLSWYRERKKEIFDRLRGGTYPGRLS